MKQHNRPKKNNADFDLDSYLNEKASETSGKTPEQKTKPTEGNFFRNLMLITGLLLLTVLSMNDWNPMNVYHRFFPAQAEFTGIPAPPVPAFPEVDARLAARNIEIDEQKYAEAVEQLTNEQAIRFNELQRKAAELANSDELAALTNEAAQTALEATLEALNQVDWDEFGRQFEGLGEQIEAEVLRGLAEANLNDYQVLTKGVNGLSLTSYTENLDKLGIDQFTSAEIEELYNAEIPIGFFEILDKTNKLSDLTAQQIIDLFD